MWTFKIIENVKEMISFAGSITAACQNEVLVATPSEIIPIASQFGVIGDVEKMIKRGVIFRMLTDIPYSGIEFIKEAIAIGEQIRHLGGYRGVYFFAHWIEKYAQTVSI